MFLLSRMLSILMIVGILFFYIIVYMTCDFPYYKKVNKNIKSDFGKLVSYKNNFIDIKEANKLVDYKFEKCKGKYVIMLDNYKDNYNINHITDYFSEYCRMLCKKYNKNKSPIDVFENIKDELYNKNIKKYRENVTYYLWKNGYMCQLFKITIIKQLYSYFNATNILDFSAGWGDRLIAACSLNVKYTGVDPSECMKEIYKNIIKTIGTNKQKIINEPFEKVVLKGGYDFIFSSPPFFKLEIYEDNIKQSVKQYSTVKLWKEKFLFVVIKKCETYLKKNGYFCIHISDYGKFNYVNDMLSYIKNKTKLEYVGKFYYIYDYGNDAYSKPLFIRIFKKN